MLRDDRITVSDIEVKLQGLFKATLIVTYTVNDTLERKVSRIPYGHYSQANEARDKVESVGCIYA
jgi:hypothetical protein